jgi:NAD(P)-dependent dehydrogenase (short-subunit alcohol dehydrogenase family)
VKAIVTGAASGIGRAAAVRLASDALTRGEEASLVLVDVSANGLASIASELKKAGAQIETLVADLAQPESAEHAVDMARQRYGGLDALISNAGMLLKGSLIDLSLEDYDTLSAVNTRATWLLAKAARPMLKASRGAIVATASISAREPTPGLGCYSATKAALIMIIRQLAQELGPEGIRCNCVSPGSTRTGINDWLLSNPEVRQARESMLPLGRIGAPEDLAAAIAFLAGPDASYITGVDLLVDGGLNTTLMPSLAAWTLKSA